MTASTHAGGAAGPVARPGWRPQPDATGPWALALTGVEMRFPDGTHALDATDLRVEPGDFVSIIGPSGCGKSTLLRLVSGLERPTSGRLELAPGNVGYVFQDPTLLPWRTVRANVELLAELDGIPAAERRRLAAEAIALTGLAGFEGHRPRALSGGMRMRVSLARSLTLKPRLFLFDEPFGALDEITRERLNDELLRLYALEGFTALFVTHSAPEAVFLSSRILVMSARPGRIVAEVRVPFRYPREPELRFDAEYARLVGVVSHALRGAVA
jgi:NitT/TauT family transport system ATP-binding protein